MTRRAATDLMFARQLCVRALLSATLLASCEWRDEPGVPAESAEVGADSAATADTASAAFDRAAGGSGEAQGVKSADSLRGDSAPAAASREELAQLAAALTVPVAGVERAQLRDTYAEARGDRVHEALDIPAPRGTPVLSAADGRLLKLFDSKPGGLMVYAADATGRFILYYGHLDRYAEALREGMPLAKGQVIGFVGTTGNAPPNTPHLHFGILRGNPEVSWSEGEPVNPYPLLVTPTSRD